MLSRAEFEPVEIPGVVTATARASVSLLPRCLAHCCFAEVLPAAVLPLVMSREMVTKLRSPSTVLLITSAFQDLMKKYWVADWEMLSSLPYVAGKEEEERCRVNCTRWKGCALLDILIKQFSQSSKELKRHAAVTGLLGKRGG